MIIRLQVEQSITWQKPARSHEMLTCICDNSMQVSIRKPAGIWTTLPDMLFNHILRTARADLPDGQNDSFWYGPWTGASDDGIGEMPAPTACVIWRTRRTLPIRDGTFTLDADDGPSANSIIQLRRHFLGGDIGILAPHGSTDALNACSLLLTSYLPDGVQQTLIRLLMSAVCSHLACRLSQSLVTSLHTKTNIFNILICYTHRCPSTLWQSDKTIHRQYRYDRPSMARLGGQFFDILLLRWYAFCLRCFETVGCASERETCLEKIQWQGAATVIWSKVQLLRICSSRRDVCSVTPSYLAYYKSTMGLPAQRDCCWQPIIKTNDDA